MKYKIIVDKQNRDNPSTEKREYEIDIEELHFRGKIYDSLVITKDEDYVMRRLQKSEYNALNVLEEPIKEPLPSLNVELFEGDNYIYLLDMIGNRICAEYLVKNDFTDRYVTKNEMNSAINQTAGQIELTVNQKLTEYATEEQLEGAVTELNSSIVAKADEIVSQVSNAKKEAIDSANASTDNKLKDYTTTNEMSSAINQKAEQIEQTVSKKLTEYATGEKLEEVVTELNSSIVTKADEITSTVSKSYATKGELDTAKSEIKQTTDNINLEVGKKVNNSDYTSAQILLMLNDDNSEVKIKGDKIDIDGKAVKFKTNISSSTYFTEADRDKALNGVISDNLTEQERELYDIDTDGVVDIVDVQEIAMAIRDNNGYLIANGTLEIDPYSGKRTIILRDENNEIKTSIGLRGIQSENLGARYMRTYWLRVMPFDTQGSNTQINIAANPEGSHIEMSSNDSTGIYLAAGGETTRIEVRGNINSGYSAEILPRIIKVNNLEAIVAEKDASRLFYGTAGDETGKTTNIRGNTVRIYSHTKGAVYLGNSGSTAITSDESLKDISDIDERYVDFFKNLKPITYVYKNRGHRNHIGFGARQVEGALGQAGLTTEQFAGILKDTDVTISADESGTEEDVHYDELYSLRYEEFIALNTMMIQKQAKEIEELKKRIEKLEGKKYEDTKN